MWIPRGRALLPHLGFPASKAEIARFGRGARRIWRVPEKKVDRRSFAEVVRGEVMDRRPPFQRGEQWNVNKKRALEEGSGSWEERRGWEREEDELRGKLLQNPRRPEGRWKQEDCRELGRNWQGDQGKQRQGDVREVPETRRSDNTRREVGAEGTKSMEPAREEIKCLNCGEFGHHQVRCSKPPLCYACKSSGHISSNYPMYGGRGGNKVEVSFKGYGVNEQGFYSMKLDVPEGGIKKKCRGILTVIRGKGSVARIETELNHLFKGLKWDWKVKQINDSDFLVDFPNEEARSKMTLVKCFDFDKFPIKASVSKSKMTDNAVDELYFLWVKMYGLPDFARSEAVIRVMSDLVGELEEIEEKSINKGEFVRMKIGCLDPFAINCSVVLYINGVGYKIRWEVERDSLKGFDMIPPTDDDDEGGDDSDKKEKDIEKKDEGGDIDLAKKDEGDKSGSLKLTQSAPPMSRSGKGVSLLNNSGDQKGEASAIKVKMTVAEEKAMVVWHPEVDSQPEILDPESQGDLSSLEELMDIDLQKGLENPVLEDETGEKCEIPIDSDIEKMRAEEEELEVDCQDQQHYQKVDTFQKVEKKNKKGAVLARREGLRVRDKDVPVQLKAEMRKSMVNLNPGISNSYAIFNSVDKSTLINIAVASNVVLGQNEDEIGMNLDAICAREKAQAVLFEAEKKKKELEQRKKEEEEMVKKSEEIVHHTAEDGGSGDEIAENGFSSEDDSVYEGAGSKGKRRIRKGSGLKKKGGVGKRKSKS